MSVPFGVCFDWCEKDYLTCQLVDVFVDREAVGGGRW